MSTLGTLTHPAAATEGHRCGNHGDDDDGDDDVDDGDGDDGDGDDDGDSDGDDDDLTFEESPKVVPTAAVSPLSSYHLPAPLTRHHST